MLIIIYISFIVKCNQNVYVLYVSHFDSTQNVQAKYYFDLLKFLKISKTYLCVNEFK